MEENIFDKFNDYEGRFAEIVECAGLSGDSGRSCAAAHRNMLKLLIFTTAGES